MARTRAEGFGPEVIRRVLLGTYSYRRVLRRLLWPGTKGPGSHPGGLARAYEQVDVLVSPTSPTVAFDAGPETSDPLAMYCADICNIPANLAGHPPYPCLSASTRRACPSDSR